MGCNHNVSRKYLPLCIAVAFLLVIAAVIGGANSISVPIDQAHYENCLKAAEAKKNTNPNCETTESLWDRGLSDPIAYFTLWLTFFTLALATVGFVQGILMRQQIQLARAEFNATHRPEIVVHSVEYVEQHLEGQTATISARVTFFNKGPTEARIRVRSGVIGRIPMPLPFTIRLNDLGGLENERIISGGRSEFFIDSTVSVQNVRTRIFDNDGIFCIGEITYADERGNIRHTGFVRCLDIENPIDGGERWMRVADENPYEYTF